MENPASGQYINSIVRRVTGINELPFDVSPNSSFNTAEIVASYDRLRGPGFLDYWRIIKKRRWLITGVFLVVVLTAALVISIMTPIYTAETTLLIDPVDRQVVNIKQVISEPQSLEEHDYYPTQYEMLKSRSLIARVIRDQTLYGHPAFRKYTTASGSGFLGWSENLFSSADAVSNGTYPKLTKIYLERILEIKPLKNSRMVTISISTPDRELSARLANAHAAAYIDETLNIRSKANKDALRFLTARLGDLKSRLQNSEVALNNFRRQRGIVSLDEKENTIVNRLADLNKSLTEAEVERISLEAQAALIRSRQYHSLPAVINNSLIQNLKNQLSQLDAEYANLDTLYTQAHPKMIQLKAQIEETRRKLEKEVVSVVGGIESAYLGSLAKERNLRDAAERQKSVALNLKDAAVEYAVLAREVDTNRQLYDNVFHRVKEIGVSTELNASNVTVIDGAVPPIKPSKPKVWLYLLVSAFVGLTGALGLALFREYLDNTLQTPEDIERYLHLPSLAAIPDFSRLNGQTLPEKIAAELLPVPSKFRNQLLISQHPHSIISEAYSMLQTSILFSRAGDPPRTILFASANPGEGKTVTVLNTGIALARTGAFVLIIDADLRSSRCHKLLGLEIEQGLTEVLTGQEDVYNVMQPTGIDFLSLLASGMTPEAPAALLGSSKMQSLLMEMRTDFAFILIDSSPIMPVTDAVRLATLVDGVILVVNSQTTPNHVVKEAYNRLSYARANILGVLLNQVDMNDQKISDYYPRYPASA